MSKGIAAGMLHLHNHNIIHRDLAARNVLVEVFQDGHIKAKICDFGLSRLTNKDNMLSLSLAQVPLRWTAPEVIISNNYCKGSDVWSFAIVLWELFTLGKEPYEGMSFSDMVQFLRTPGNHISPPDACPDPVKELMISCWESDPANRPNFREINKKYVGIEKWMEENGEKNMYVYRNEEKGEEGSKITEAKEQTGKAKDKEVHEEPELYYADSTEIDTVMNVKRLMNTESTEVSFIYGNVGSYLTKGEGHNKARI